MPRVTIGLPYDHPVFAGHFPGHPVVPGVLLLDAVQHAVQSKAGLTLVGIAAAKFVSPTIPDEVLSVEYEAGGMGLHFEISCGARKVAGGRFLVATSSSP